MNPKGSIRRKLMATMMDFSIKAAQKHRSKGCDWSQLYFSKLKAISFQLFYKEVTGRKSTVAKNMISLKIILRPWSKPTRLHLLNISRKIIMRQTWRWQWRLGKLMKTTLQWDKKNHFRILNRGYKIREHYMVILLYFLCINRF